MNPRFSNQERIKILLELQEKYCDLVWLARKEPEWLRDDHPAMPKMVQVKMKYPEEAEQLSCPDEGDWAHGFNSGCLAAFRLAVGLLDCQRSGVKTELDEFPFLDT